MEKFLLSAYKRMGQYLFKFSGLLMSNNLLFRWISKSPKYIREFGILHGLRLLFSVERSVPQRSIKINKYKVPGYKMPILLRETVSDHATFWQCIVQRQYGVSVFPQSNRLISAYQDALDNGSVPIIIDCGGNIGLSALYFAELFPKARIYSVEPNEENFEMLKRNTATVADRVFPLRGGVWNERDNLRIVNPESGSAAFRVAPTAEYTNEDRFRTYTINEICALAEVSAPLIVKIDIEGAQRNLFMSNTEWVCNTHLIMLELDDWQMPWQGTSTPFFSCISQHSFDYLISGETIFCFRDFGQ
ncbi:MAG: FkbM family methyltransferase [Candidatus Accumulibacter sp.]|jgi:FkbM family methyltransferase|uniref:FkbM family methyltransferase n=1 Tax=Accumulibacter sp. TaxID=2053492 RepID=UPI001AD0D503|nr:FkbM family methyltransferase [Accumulibacter sp.]MBN8439033.1 FkbM family methyltransferase [Accumulibacter sp.]